MSRRSRQTLDSTLANEFVFGMSDRPVNHSDEISQLKDELNRLQTQPQDSLASLPVNKVIPLRLPEGMKQPRKYFDPAAMERLKASIDKHGVCEPILTRPSGDGFFEIVSGERRWRSAKALGHSEIPGVTKEMNDEESLEIALIAHLLSENISAIEETDSLIGLISLRTSLEATEIPSRLKRVRNAQVRQSDYSGIITINELQDVEVILGEFGISLAGFVSNRLPLLDLPGFIMESVREGALDPSKAILVARTKPDFQPQLVDEVVNSNLTKEQLRKRIAELKTPGNGDVVSNADHDANDSGEPTFSNVQKLYSQVSKKLSKKDVSMTRKMQVRINRIELALRELLDEIS